MASLRAVLYVRVSKNDGDQDPASQLAVLRPWAKARGWRVVAECEDRVTGDPVRRRRNPPGLVQALGLLEQGKANVLGIFAADRLVRSPTHLLDLVGQVQSWGGRVASFQDGADLDTTTDQGELFLFIQGWMAKFALKLTRARTLAGLERAKAEGKQLGRPGLELPALESVEQLIAEGVRGRKTLAARLGCSPWAVRRALDELAKKGRAIRGLVLTEPKSQKQAGE